MSIISQKDDPNDKKGELTPWQKANLDYLRKKKAERAKKEQPSDKEHQKPDDTHLRPLDEGVTEQLSLEELADDKEKFSFHLPENRPLFFRSTLLITLFMIPALVLGYYISPFSKLASVSVKNTQHVAVADVKTDLGFTVGDNLWPQYFSKDAKIAQLKKKQVRVKDASIKFDGVNRLVVTVNEYDEVALLEHNGKYSPIISNGKIMAKNVKKTTGDLPILENFKSKTRILTVLNGYTSLSEAIQQGISQIKYAPTKENKELLQIYMNDGNQVLISSADIKKKMPYYPQVVKQMNKKKMKGIVDMEAGIYSYPYPNEKRTKSSIQKTTKDSNNLSENE